MGGFQKLRRDEERNLTRLFRHLKASSSRVLAWLFNKNLEYTAARVDAQSRAVAREVNAASYRPLQQEVPDPFDTQGTCPLGCCSANQKKPVSSQVQSLFFRFLNFKPSRSGLSTAGYWEKFRRETVELAATITRSSETIQATHATLRKILPSIDPPKLVRMWRVLARPVTNLRILSQIARLLPHFQHITFLTIPRPAPLKLEARQAPTLAEAWKHLGLPTKRKRRLPAAMARKTGDFTSAYTLDLFTHCEIQLLTRYGSDPSFSPTLPYFGCSKKACFLCGEYLALSPMNFRTRGRHGRCHPQWGLDSCNFESTRQRLGQLCEVIKLKIRATFEPGSSKPLAVNQSSAVFDLRHWI
jgi:hypothetical protein